MTGEKAYREQALKLFPWICGRCAREFSGARLRELTVHHKDGNHDRNPPDGSNWELLCIYCHENEHARAEDAKAGGTASAPASTPPRAPARAAATHRPFADLAKKLRGS